MKKQDRMKQWIEETQMFQRIAKVPVSSYEELENDWNKMREQTKKFMADNTSTNLIILQEASKNRKN